MWTYSTLTFDFESYFCTFSVFLVAASEMAAHRFVVPHDTWFNFICTIVYKSNSSRESQIGFYVII